MISIGVDPGKYGAYAVISRSDEDPTRFRVIDLDDQPLICVSVKKVNRKNRQGELLLDEDGKPIKREKENLQPDLVRMGTLVRGWKDYWNSEEEEVRGALEKTYVDPRDGRLGAATLARYGGIWEGLFAAIDLKLDEHYRWVSAKEWRSVLFFKYFGGDPELDEIYRQVEASTMKKGKDLENLKKAKKRELDKRRSRELASELFPKVAPKFRLRNSDGLAEACLLAYYGALTDEEIAARKKQAQVYRRQANARKKVNDGGLPGRTKTGRNVRG